MKNIKHQILLDFYKLSDLLLIAFSFIISIQINFENFINQLELRLKFDNAIIGIILLISNHFILKYLNLYSSKKFTSFFNELKAILTSISINSILLAFTGFLFSSSLININCVIYYFILNLLFLSLSRCILFSIIKLNKTTRTAIIVGTSNRAIQLANELPSLGYKLLGFVDSFYCSKITTINNYEQFIENNHIDEIFICSSIKTQYDFIEKIISIAEEQGILVRLSTNLFDLKIAKAKIEYFNSNPMLTLYTGNMYRKMVIIKEIFDTILATIMFILTLPILIITAIMIKLTSKGPIFFLQERVGINKKLFKVYKFRTMIQDAESKIKELEHLNERKGEATFKITNDPRITKIGKFIRKFSIDELPQLINVIKGDMSIVGPRPLPVRDYRNFNENWQRRRFSVKPGITCIWQISGRNNIKFHEWMKMDNEYIDTWTILLDLKIIIKTIPAVLFAKGSS